VGFDSRKQDGWFVSIDKSSLLKLFSFSLHFSSHYAIWFSDHWQTCCSYLIFTNQEGKFMKKKKST